MLSRRVNVIINKIIYQPPDWPKGNSLGRGFPCSCSSMKKVEKRVVCALLDGPEASTGGKHKHWSNHHITCELSHSSKLIGDRAMEAAIVTVSTGVLKPLLSKLFKLLQEEHAKLKGIRRDARFIGDEMRSMKAALEALADEEQLEPEMRIWRDEVRELSYDMEDCLDDFVARVGYDPDGSTALKKLFDM